MSLQLVVLTVARLFLTIMLRMTYPFLPELARGLDVSLTEVSRLVTLRNMTGLLSPFFGPLSDRFGRRPIIIFAMFLFALGSFLIVLWPTYWFLGATLVITSLAKIIFDPAVHAYLGDNIPYRQRGRAIAVTEFSWAGALLLGAPAVGYLIQRQGWRAPFFWLGLSMLAVLILVWRILPTHDGGNGQIRSLRDTWHVIRQERVIWAAFAYILLVMGANELVFIVYGEWMESTFNLGLTDLGLTAGVIGVAEIVGEVVAGWGVDHFGKRPVILTTALITCILYLVIPFTGSSLIATLTAWFGLFLFFEITVVGGIPLMTEIVPGARGVVLSMVIAAASIGRTLGSYIGPQIRVAGDLFRNGVVAAVLMLIATFILWRWIRESQPVAAGIDASSFRMGARPEPVVKEDSGDGKEGFSLPNKKE